MTVIAWDGVMLAADKRTSFSSLHGTTTKVQRVRGALVAGAGLAPGIQEMIQWFSDGAKPETFPAWQRNEKECIDLLVAWPDQLLQYSITPYPIVIENKQWAIGSGRDFALMAMHLGKTAAEAVALTSLFCHDCGNGVDYLTHESNQD